MICTGWNPLKSCGGGVTPCKGSWFWIGLVLAALFGHQDKIKRGR
jgi:hypothetical protein